MLITAVLDPTAYHKNCFSNPGYRDNAEMFLRGIWTNGLLLVDSNGQLSDELQSAIETLPTSIGQSIAIWLQELLKNKRKRVIKSRCPKSVHSHQLIFNVAQATTVDSVIASASTHKLLSRSCGLVVTILELSSYLGSSLERKRFNYEQGLHRIDALPKSDVDEAFKRTTRFSSRLRFYDKQIGQGKNTSHFRKGISYILDIWKQSGYFQGLGQFDVEIITALKNSEVPKHTDNEAVYIKVVRELLDPLRDRYPAWNIDLKFKVDPDGIFHRRYLESQAVILEIDRGFDLFRPGGKLKRNTLRLEPNAFEHLRECRALQDAEFLADQVGAKEKDN